MAFDATDAEIARREHAAEMGEETESERAWFRFCNAAENALREEGVISSVNGSSIDGEEAEDGFSLDGCYDAWEAGKSVGAYVEQVVAARAKLAS